MKRRAKLERWKKNEWETGAVTGRITFDILSEREDEGKDEAPGGGSKNGAHSSEEGERGGATVEKVEARHHIVLPCCRCAHLCWSFIPLLHF